MGGATAAVIDPKTGKKRVEPINLLVGATLNIFEVSTLGQPFEVLKTHLAANRGDSLLTAFNKTRARGGLFGWVDQGLVPWALIEASTKGAVLIFAAAEVEHLAVSAGANKTGASIIGGMGGGIAQAYATMGFCTFMKTVEVTRHKAASTAPQSTWQIAAAIYKKEGIVGINRGVNAVAVRQMTNWGSRFGISRIVENMIRSARGDTKPDQPLPPLQKILASGIGGALSCWNQPIEVIRVELQSQIKQPGRPENMSIAQAFRWIVQQNGYKGLYRGVTPRVCLGMWQTICMVSGGDWLKQKVAQRYKSK